MEEGCRLICDGVATQAGLTVTAFVVMAAFIGAGMSAANSRNIEDNMLTAGWCAVLGYILGEITVSSFGLAFWVVVAAIALGIFVGRMAWSSRQR